MLIIVLIMYSSLSVLLHNKHNGQHPLTKTIPEAHYSATQLALHQRLPHQNYS